MLGGVRQGHLRRGRSKRARARRLALVCVAALATGCRSAVPDGLACADPGAGPPPAADAVEACVAQEEVRGVLERMKRDAISRWQHEKGSGFGSVLVRFRLTSDGRVDELCIADASSRTVAREAASLLLTYRPVDPYPAEAACLAGFSLTGRFDVRKADRDARDPD